MRCSWARMQGPSIDACQLRAHRTLSAPPLPLPIFPPSPRTNQLINVHADNPQVYERHVAPVVSCRTYADVGAFDEVDGQTGVAHLLEHMVSPDET